MLLIEPPLAGSLDEERKDAAERTQSGIAHISLYCMRGENGAVGFSSKRTRKSFSHPNYISRGRALLRITHTDQHSTHRARGCPPPPPPPRPARGAAGNTLRGALCALSGLHFY